LEVRMEHGIEARVSRLAWNLGDDPGRLSYAATSCRSG